MQNEMRIVDLVPSKTTEIANNAGMTSFAKNAQAESHDAALKTYAEERRERRGGGRESLAGSERSSAADVLKTDAEWSGEVK